MNLIREDVGCWKVKFSRKGTHCPGIGILLCAFFGSAPLSGLSIELSYCSKRNICEVYSFILITAHATNRYFVKYATGNGQ